MSRADFVSGLFPFSPPQWCPFSLAVRLSWVGEPVTVEMARKLKASLRSRKGSCLSAFPWSGLLCATSCFRAARCHQPDRPGWGFSRCLPLSASSGPTATPMPVVGDAPHWAGESQRHPIPDIVCRGYCHIIYNHRGQLGRAGLGPRAGTEKGKSPQIGDSSKANRFYS